MQHCLTAKKKENDIASIGCFASALRRLFVAMLCAFCFAVYNHLSSISACVFLALM